MRRVLVVITTGFVSWGGLTSAFMNYFRSMNKDGLQIDIASMNVPNEKLLMEIKKYGCNYIQFPDKRKHTLRYLYSFSKTCVNYDVIHIHGNSATMAGELWIAKMKNVQIRIAHCHTNKCMHKILNAVCLPVFLASYTKGIAVSKSAGEWLYGKHKFEILNNVIDTSKYIFNDEIRDRIRYKYNILPNDIVIGHVGKIYEAKNHSFLIRVFSKIAETKENIKLLLVGDGVLKHDITNLIHELGVEDKVIFTGMQDDSSPFYSAIDIFMFPSLYEGFPLALLEAQAAGLYCIASKMVPKDCNVTGKVRYLELNEDVWIRKFNRVIDDINKIEYSRNKESEEAIKQIIHHGYDSFTNAEKLKEIYMDNILEE